MSDVPVTAADSSTATAKSKIGVYPWYVVAFMLVASTFSYIDRQILGLMVGPVRRDLNITDTEMGLLMGAAFVIIYTIVTVPMAWIADHWSRRAVIGWGIFFWSLATAFSGFVKSFWPLFGARMGVGVGEATLGPASYSLLSDYFDKARLPFAIGIVAAAPFIGTGLANIVGGSLVEYLESLPPIEPTTLNALLGTDIRFFSWQLTFLAVGLPGIFLALLIFTVREPARKGRAVHDAPMPWDQVLEFLRERWKFFTFHFLGFLGLSIQGWALFAWIIEYFIRNHGWARSDAGLRYGLVALIFGILGSVVGGIVATRMIERGRADATLRLVAWGTAFLAPLAIVMTLLPNPWLALAILCPMTIFMSMPPGLGNTALTVIAPNELRGRVIALYLICVNFLAYLLAPLVIGIFNDQIFGYEGIGYSISTLAAITYPAAAVSLFLCLKHFRVALDKAKAWD